MKILALWLLKSNIRIKIIMILVLFLGSMSAMSEFYFINQTSRLLELFTDSQYIINLQEKINSKEIFVLFYTILLLWLATFVRLSNIYFIGWAASKWSRDISRRILITTTKNPETLGQERRNNYLSSLTEQATELSWMCIRPFFRVSNNIFVIFAIAYASIKENVIAGTAVISILALIYSITALLSRSKIISHSNTINKMQLKMSSHIIGITNNLFEVFTSPKNSFFYKEAEYIQEKLRDSQVKSHFYQVFPRYLIEALGITLLIGVAFGTTDEVKSGFVTAGVLAIASQRMLPMAQEIYGSYISIRSSTALLKRFDKYLNVGIRENSLKVINKKNNILIDDIVVKKGGENILMINGHYILHDKKINIITGKSGKGKTTFIRLLSGFEKLQEGSIELNNIKISNSEIKACIFKNYMSSLALVTQEADAINGSILRNVALKDNLSTNEKDSAESALKTVGLYSEIKSILHKNEISNDLKLLSGGQLRRLSLARAIYGKKKIILLDEPTSGLDKVNINLVAESINQCSKKANIVLSTHDQYLINLLKSNIGTIIRL